MNTLTQDCLEIKVSDDVVWNSYIGEFEIWVDGTKTHARDEGVAWRMFRERKELARRHVERNPANRPYWSQELADGSTMQIWTDGSVTYK